MVERALGDVKGGGGEVHCFGRRVVARARSEPRASPSRPAAAPPMSRLVIGSRAELITALRKQIAERGGAVASAAAAALAEEARALAEELVLDALFLVAQFPGGQIAEADKCCYAFDVRLCAGLCRATWAEEAFWSGLVRVSHAGPRKVTRLMYAAAHGDAARVAWLLARGSPREAKDSYGFTALYWASLNGHIDVVRALLAAGTNVEEGGHGGATPLWISAYTGQTDVLSALLAAGANVEATAASIYGWRPLHEASFYDRVAAATLLLDAGADVNALDNAGRSPLYTAKTPTMRALLIARGGV
jgi:hypothetical protein